MALAADWRKILGVYLHNLYRSPNITVIKLQNMAHRRVRGAAYSGLVRKRPPGRSKHRQEVNSEMDIKEISREREEWLHVVRNRDIWRIAVSTTMHVWFDKRREIC